MDFRATRAGSEHGMGTFGRWLSIGALAALVAVVPFSYYRYEYTNTKRLRIVAEGKLYRSGQLSVDGLTQAVLKYGIRTVINVQDDVPDPGMITNWFNPSTIPESVLCRQLGVHYVHLSPDLVSRTEGPPERAAAIDRFLEIMDEPMNHPVLIHCRAGLHRTGCLCAIYRMEYQGWSREQSLEELQDHGFGIFFCSSANDYVQQYVLSYQRGIRSYRPGGQSVMPASSGD
jgi:protein tyrosine phosphatase (PTP) superfamily phosphohydrolase (DUF442 family)